MGIGAKLKKALSNVESGVRETAAKVRSAGAGLERGVRRGAAGIRRVGAGTERLQRNIASAVKSGYQHPGASIKAEASRTGKKSEEAIRTAAHQGSQFTITGQEVRAAQRQLQAPAEEAPPPIPEPTPMPIPDEALSMVARRRQRARRKGARGSSILSGSQDTLG